MIESINIDRGDTIAIISLSGCKSKGYTVKRVTEPKSHWWIGSSCVFGKYENLDRAREVFEFQVLQHKYN